MRLFTLPFIVGLVVVCSAAAPAEAQRRQRVSRTPDTGNWAVGASVGATSPNNANLDPGLDVGGGVEGYLTPRLSVRGQLRSAWLGFEEPLGFTGTLQPTFFTGNLVYNMEHGVWHPYVTGGVGAYRYHWTEPGVPNGSNTYSGVNLGGGVEYFFTRDATLTTEFIFHKVGDVDVARATLHDGSFWSVTMGGKKYF